MTTQQMIATFRWFRDTDNLGWAGVKTRRSSRPDIHAFILLNELVPGTEDMVSVAGHDNIWLAAPPERLAAVATDDIVLELVRCGVRYDNDVDSLAMFV